MLLLVPNGLREAASSLGAPMNHVIRAVTWKAAQAGIVTGILLAIARISGETAPLLFTALGNSYWSPGILKPSASLPVMIFNYATSPYDDWHRQAWAAGLVLLTLVLAANVGARALLGGRRQA
jgi:phosphate transport system permease protein